MDEPFGAIDPITRVDLQNEFLKIQQEIQKTIIFVTHDIYEAIKMGDEIALMKEGRLVQYAPPADLLYRPKDEFVAGFVGADRALKGLQLIRTKEVMHRSPPTAKREDKAGEVRTRMERENIDWMPVVDDEGGFLGWIFEPDLKGEGAVKDAMSPSTISTTRNSVLNEALSLMLTSGLNVLAIVDRDNRLEGLLSFGVIQEALREASQKEESP
jgi:osmoprotectant transport system ATP-binding protein